MCMVHTAYHSISHGPRHTCKRWHYCTGPGSHRRPHRYLLQDTPMRLPTRWCHVHGADCLQSHLRESSEPMGRQPLGHASPLKLGHLAVARDTHENTHEMMSCAW